jgi:hypothetical protein
MPQNACLINSGEIVTRIAEEIQTDFINFDRHISADIANALWQTSDLAERSPATSDFFLNCCTCLGFAEILETLKTDLFVFLPDEALGDILAEHAIGSGFAVERFSRYRLHELLPAVVKRVVNTAGLLILALRRRIEFLRQFHRNKSTLSNHRAALLAHRSNASEKPDVLMVTWAESNTFVPNKTKISDRYFGNLVKELQERGSTVGYIINPYPLPLEDILTACKSSSDWVLFPDECWGWKDVIKSLLTTLFWRIPISPRFVLKGIDLTEVLRHEIRVERSKIRQCQAMRHLHVGRYLKNNGLKPNTLIFPYENQPWEKALRIGVKAHLPETMLVGYMGTTFAPLWICIYPSRQDLENGQVLDALVTSGPLWSRLLLDKGYPGDKLHTGPALRFSHIFERAREPRTTLSRNSTSNYEILVVLPSTYDQAMDVLHKVMNALRATARVTVRIKFHPDFGESETSNILKAAIQGARLTELPGHFSVTRSPVDKLLAEIDIVIENGSSVGIEAAAAGATVVHVPTDLWFDMNKLAYFPSWSLTCRTSDEIRDCVAELTTMGKGAHYRRSPVSAGLLDLLSPPGESALENLCSILVHREFGQSSRVVPNLQSA